MKKCSTIDTDDILYRLCKEAVSTGAVRISGDVCADGERPDDSEKEDIVINTIAITHDKPQTGTSNVNIYVPDLFVTIRKRKQRKQNRERLRELGDALVAYFEAQNLPDLEFWVENDTVLAETSINQHYRNIRIGWNIH